MKLIVYAVIFFMTIGQSIAGIWQCPEKTSDRDIEYTISFDSPEKNTDIITMRHIDTQTNQDAKGQPKTNVWRFGVNVCKKYPVILIGAPQHRASGNL